MTAANRLRSILMYEPAFGPLRDFPFWHVFLLFVVGAALCFFGSGCDSIQWEPRDDDQHVRPDDEDEDQDEDHHKGHKGHEEEDPFGSRERGTVSPASAPHSDRLGAATAGANAESREQTAEAACRNPFCRCGDRCACHPCTCGQSALEQRPQDPVVMKLAGENDRLKAQLAQAMRGGFTGAYVYGWMSGCGACERLKRDLHGVGNGWKVEEVSVELDARGLPAPDLRETAERAVFRLANVDPDRCGLYVPMVVYYKDGREVGRIEGYRGTADELRMILAKHPHCRQRLPQTQQAPCQSPAFAPQSTSIVSGFYVNPWCPSCPSW